MTTWYERNREKAIENAKTWRLNNLERFRELNRNAKARKRGTRQVSAPQKASIWLESLPLAPEGYDPALDGDLQEWCLMHGVPFDPKQW